MEHYINEMYKKAAHAFLYNHFNALYVLKSSVNVYRYCEAACQI
jgi:hypothetical protein